MAQKLTNAHRYAKPAHAGHIVRFPVTMAILPQSGAAVAWTGSDGKYWRKCFNRGDIVIQKQPPSENESYKKEESYKKPDHKYSRESK